MVVITARGGGPLFLEKVCEQVPKSELALWNFGLKYSGSPERGLSEHLSHMCM